MEPIITVNEYPIGWEWLDRVPLEDFTWLIEIFSTITDNTDTYDFATFDKEATNGEPPYPVIEIKEIIYNNLYDTLIDELKDTISRFQAQYNIQEINPYLQDILQNPGDLVSLSQQRNK